MSNISPQPYTVHRLDREKRNKHRAMVVWFTGLSGSGKSSIANAVESQLFEAGKSTFSLDGDNMRLGLNAGLGFSTEDRTENLRRIGEVAKLFLDAGCITLCAFVSPLIANRDMIRKIVGPENFLEIHVHASLSECERRDVKGLYKKARSGEILNFTGISAPYEMPVHPDLKLDTEEMSLEEAAHAVVELIVNRTTHE